MGRGIFLLVAILFANPLFSQQRFSEQYQKGMEALSVNDTTSAEAFFRESVSNYFDAPSYFRLGMLLNEKRDAKSKKAALYNLKNAADNENTNLTYRLAYAELTNDIEIIKKVIKDFPNSELPLISAGKLMLTCYKYYKNLATVKENMKEWELAKNSVKYFNAGVEFLQFALKMAESNLKAHLLLAELYFTRGEFEKSAYYLMVTLSLSPKNKDAHLLYGMTLCRINKIREAGAEFEKAFSLMEKEEKDEYTYKSVIELLRPQYNIDEKYDTRKEIELLIQKFWKVMDPGELNDTNVRLVEHYARTAFTNLNFASPRAGLKGWQTERGEMYIRLGAPDYIKIFNAYDDYPFTEVWNYENISFSFGNYSDNGNLVLTGDNEENIYAIENSYSKYEELKYTSFQYFRSKEERWYYGTQLLLFKSLNNDENDSFDAYFVYQIPWEIKNPVQNNVPGCGCSISLYDWEIDPVAEKRESVPGGVIKEILAEEKNPKKTDCFYFQLPVEKGLAVFKIKAEGDSSLFTSNKYIDAVKFPNSSLSISVPVTAGSLVKNSTIPGGINRNGISFVPQINGVLNPGERTTVYFEIYGLKKDEKGFTYFDQSVRVLELKEYDKEEGSLWSVIKKFFHSIFGKSNELTLTSSHKTKYTNVQQYTELNLDTLKRGKYVLDVSITDKVSGEKRENSCIIEIK